MKAGIEFSCFVALAAAGHLLFWQQSPGAAMVQAATGGEPGAVLATGTTGLTELVTQWDRPVTAVQEIVQPAPTVPETAPTLAMPPPKADAASLPTILSAPTGAAPADTLPDVDAASAPLRHLAVRSSIRPQERVQPREPAKAAPEPEAPKKPRLAEIRKPQAAAANAGSNTTTAGAGGRKKTGATPSAGTAKVASTPALMAQWGNSIRAGIERRKRYPAGTRARGTVTLSVSVSTGGALAGVSIQRSSGDAALDRAAVAAVERARLKPAPQGLAPGVHRFSLPMVFAP